MIQPPKDYPTPKAEQRPDPDDGDWYWLLYLSAFFALGGFVSGIIVGVIITL